MHVMVYGSPSSTALGRMCARGFRQLGHEVRYFGRDPISLPVVGDLNMASVVSNFREEAVAADPDLILVVKGYDLPHDAVESIADRTDAVVVNWNPDNPYQVRSTPKRAETYLDALDAYDRVFTWGEFLVPQLRRDGATAVSYLPFGFDPEIHRVTDPRQKYDCTVAFLGHHSPKRERYLSALTEFDLLVYGNGWRHHCFDRDLRAAHRGPALGATEYARAMASADIVLNIVADHNIPAHNMRTFEVPATESFMLTTRTDGQRQYFPDGEACVMYESPSDLRDAVEAYEDRPERRAEIESRGSALVEDHTYTDRMRRLLDIVTRRHGVEA